MKDICSAYRITSAEPDEIGWIAGSEARVFDPEDAVPENLLAEWYNRNSSGFNIIRMRDGQKAGHLVCLPLRPAALKALVDGHVIEKEIRGDCLFTLSERHLIKTLYVESLIVQRPEGHSNAPAILCLLNNFRSLLRKICDPSKVESVVATAASKPGENLLRSLGFAPIASGGERVDRRELFQIRLPELAGNITAICEKRLPQPTFDKIPGD